MKCEFPILQGIYVDSKSFDFRVARPKNLYVVPKATGTGMGFLRQMEGYKRWGPATFDKHYGPGDRAAIVWRDHMYRLNESAGALFKFNKSSNIAEIIPLPHGVDKVHCSLDYSFDNLIICANKHLYYYNETDGLREVTDQSLGEVHDALFIDGYTMTTDGGFLVVTELNDPMAINPLKYGSSEADPDPVVAIRRVRGEIYALNRYTIEVFQNVGGDNFPFQRVDGALCMKGCLNRNCAAVLGEVLIFVGGARNEGLGLYMYNNGLAHKLSTNDVDKWLDDNADNDLCIETRVFEGFQFVYMHSTTGTLLFDFGASQELQQPVFIDLHHVSETDPDNYWSAYRLRNFTQFNNAWIAADTYSDAYYSGMCEMTLDNPSSLHGINQWEFTTPMIYAEGAPAIVNELELVCAVGPTNSSFDTELLVPSAPKLITQYSNDGRNWSRERTLFISDPGYRTKRVAWFRNGLIRNWRLQRVRGFDKYRITMTRFQADMEVLNGGQAR